MKYFRNILAGTLIMLICASSAFAATAYNTIQFRRGTAAAWTAADPILAEGEPGFETDSGEMKIGDGTTHWVSLSYFLQTGTAAGATTQVQYNDASAMAGDAELTWDKATNLLGAYTIDTKGISATGLTGTSGNVIYINGAGTFSGKLLLGATASTPVFWFDYLVNMELTGNIITANDKPIMGRNSTGTAKDLVSLATDNKVHLGNATSSLIFDSTNISLQAASTVILGINSAVILGNESVYQAKDTGGTARNVASIGSDDHLYIGATNATIPLYLGAGSGLTDPVYIRVGSADNNITAGANDSGGAGFRLLVVPNI